jgi:hypothetical protein
VQLVQHAAAAVHSTPVQLPQEDCRLQEYLTPVQGPVSLPRTNCLPVLPCLRTCSCGIDEETAARIAREIERGDTSNPHLAEERGQEVDDSGVRCTALLLD